MDKQNLKELKISIGGRVFSINTDEREEVVIQAANLVDSFLKKVSDGMSFGSKDTQVAILIALQIAVDLVKKNETLNLWQSETAALTAIISS